MQEEARPMIEQYFDQALYNNVESIKIIHGKGSGALRRQLQQLIKEYKLNFDFYFTDQTTLKTIVRSNPGVLVLEKGTIKQKVHYNDLDEIQLP